MNKTRTRIAALLLTAAALTTACGADDAAQPEAPIGGSADPFPPRTPDADEPAEQARQQATAAIEAYNDVSNALYTDPSGDQAQIATVATGRAAEFLAGDIDGIAAEGARLSGDALIADMTITNLNITTEVAEVDADVCYDLTDARGLNAAGEDVTEPDRPDFVLERYTVTNPSWPDAEGWRVSDTEQRNQPCEPA